MVKNKKDRTTTEKTEDNENDDISITDDIRGAEYYHGLVPRTDIEPLLKKEGDFLLRKTEHNPGEIVLALSVRHDGHIRHFMINQDDDHTFYLENHREKTVAELINWHRSTRTPLSSSTPAKLRRPVERPAWLLNHDSIKLSKKLGEGAFGEVYLAEYTSAGDRMEVAVKTMREEATRDARLKFMKEARLMRKFQHKNVVRIMGVAVHEHPLMLIMELCPGGSVLTYLRKNRGNVDQKTKLRFVSEAAEGLYFLERQKCIHRDIAARNCLLSAKLDLKVADFGMSDDRCYMHDDKLDKVPVKWLAPETMQNKIYSNKTDVWSFSILVYEIYSDGAEPYAGMTNIQTRAKIVVTDYRMEMPKDCPPKMVALVTLCWSKDPNKRPDFGKITKMLKEIKV
ncbi:unnamed protein product [Bursaphelenchus okinawaensis]|uniref:Tyrosine-protein kinase n=1 Tax=Bursaphelenchus okinawaensis TaxID=465554 RepID=A0A811KW99_9BILA|nr:unnamed protein product [Bursaphelenchus okinawaensis]CAG9113206.1 unnamed protein product [Bursaphelenchus okinawaensis]